MKNQDLKTLEYGPTWSVNPIVSLLVPQDSRWTRQWATPNWETLCSSMTWTCSTTYRTGQLVKNTEQKHDNTTAQKVSVFTGCCFFWNRREVYRILQEEGIDLPRYAVLNRDPDKPDGETDGSYSVFRQKKHHLRAQWCKTTLTSFQHMDEFWTKRVTVAEHHRDW